MIRARFTQMARFVMASVLADASSKKVNVLTSFSRFPLA